MPLPAPPRTLILRIFFLGAVLAAGILPAPPAAAQNAPLLSVTLTDDLDPANRAHPLFYRMTVSNTSTDTTASQVHANLSVLGTSYLSTSLQSPRGCTSVGPGSVFCSLGDLGAQGLGSSRVTFTVLLGRPNPDPVLAGGTVAAQVSVMDAGDTQADDTASATTTLVDPPANPCPTPCSSATPKTLASSFEVPVCGDYLNPPAGCEFGIQGQVQQGTAAALGIPACRTGPGCVRLTRTDQGEGHVHVVRQVPLPDPGDGSFRNFVGSAHLVPSLVGQLPAANYIELVQVTPSDRSLPTTPVELRIYSDRRLGLGLMLSREVAFTNWQAPVGQWFSVVMEIVRGKKAVQSLWVYDANDVLVDAVHVTVPTAGSFNDGPRQAIGSTRHLAPGDSFSTYADNWYISQIVQGPLRLRTAKLALAASDSPDPVHVGQHVTYSFTATNGGPFNGTNVKLVNTLPPGVTFSSASPGCSAAGSVVTCALGTIAPGGTVSVTIVGTVTATGTLKDKAKLSGAESDPFTGDNSRTVTTDARA